MKGQDPQLSPPRVCKGCRQLYRPVVCVRGEKGGKRSSKDDWEAVEKTHGKLEPEADGKRTREKAGLRVFER